MTDNLNETAESVEEVETEDTELETVGQANDAEVDEQDHDEEDDQGFDRERVLNKLRKLNSENRNLRKAKKEAEAKAEQAGADSERVQALEAVKARYETLGDNNLPLKLAKWIDATEPDEILEQAEEILSLGERGVTPPPTDTPKERVKRNRKQVTQVDEIGDLDDFAAKIYKD